MERQNNEGTVNRLTAPVARVAPCGFFLHTFKMLLELPLEPYQQLLLAFGVVGLNSRAISGG
jgi:hypothetical protein